MKNTQIFLLGLIGLYAAFAITVRPVWFIILACIALLCIVGLGMTLIPKDEISATWVPGQSKPVSIVLHETEIGALYPQLIVFRLRLSNIWLLFGLCGYAIYWLMWTLDEAPAELFLGFGTFGLSMFNWSVYGSILCFYFAWKWLRERWILKHQISTLGLVIPDGLMIRYEYFGTDGERYGGIRKRKIWSAAHDPITAVFVDPNSPERNEPAFDFLYHRLEVVDKIHWPLERFDPEAISNGKEDPTKKADE
ncbi:MAG: hypothetical protein HYX26_09085 [Acidobacteriales bacterium]|nr:hypothetical protein [Terriglobales bacterium]